MNKRDELEKLIESLDKKPHLIAVTEVKNKAKREVRVSEFNLGGYEILVNDFGKNTRGILVYVRSDILYSEVNMDNEFEEIVGMKLVLRNLQEVWVGIVYRSPNSLPENNARLFEFIRKVSEEHVRVVLIGDFNFPHINWNTWTVENGIEEKKFLEVLRDTYMMQYVTEPTRFRSSDCPHILDLVLSNADIITDLEFLSPLGKSDHSVLTLSILGSNEDKKSFSKLNYNKGNYEEMRKCLDIDWEGVFLSITVILKEFGIALKEGYKNVLKGTFRLLRTFIEEIKEVGNNL